jgi:hypothetical protein
MADINQWEYRVVSAGTFWTKPKDENLEAILDELGEDGWEVISVFSQYGSNQVRVVAKRLLSGETRRRRAWPG